MGSEKINHEYAQVIKSKPVYEEIEIIKPHYHSQDCYETYEVHRPRKRRVSENNLGLDTIIGVASGVVLGNQIGKGNGRVAAKVIGGIVGGTVANKIRNYSYNNGSDTYEQKRRLVCENVRNRYESKRVLKGYKNIFYYQGKKYSKFSKRPKDYVRVTTTMRF